MHNMFREIQTGRHMLRIDLQWKAYLPCWLYQLMAQPATRLSFVQLARQEIEEQEWNYVQSQENGQLFWHQDQVRRG